MIGAVLSRLGVAAGLFLLGAGAALHAAERPLAVHGFASQAYLSSSGNHYYGESRNGSLDFTELGVNARYTLAPSAYLVGQVVSRRAGELYDGQPRLDFAFLDYRWRSDASGVAGLRLGRSKIQIGFYNDTRDVAATRPGILLPQSIYVEGLGIRDFYIGADGLHLFREWFGAHSSVQLDFGIAAPTVMEEETKEAFLGPSAAGADGDLTLSSGQNVRLMVDRHGGAQRYALTYSRVRTEYDPSGATALVGAGRIAVDSAVLSGQWNHRRLSLTAEGALRRVETRDFPQSLPNDATVGGEYYVQATYRFAPRWEGFLRYDSHWRDLDDRDGSAASAASQQLAASIQTPSLEQAPHRFFQRQWTFGGAWRVTPAWQLRAEWHRIDGTALTPAPDNREFSGGGGKRRWSLWAVQAAYTF